MRKQIANIKVFLDTESAQSSASGLTGTGPNDYRLEMNVKNGGPATEIKTMEQFQTVMAHELGHIIAMITKDETHVPLLRLLAQITGDPSPLIPQEKKAWELARKMVPKIDEGIATAAMDSYTINSKCTWTEPDPEESWENEGGMYHAVNLPSDPIPQSLGNPYDTDYMRARYPVNYDRSDRDENYDFTQPPKWYWYLSAALLALLTVICIAGELLTGTGLN